LSKFKHYDDKQSSMVVINYEDQLQPGTFEHAIHHLIDNKLDLSIFHPNYQNDDNGLNAYIPDNQFRSRDPRFADHKRKHGKKPAVTGKPWGGDRKKGVIPASEFSFDAIDVAA